MRLHLRLFAGLLALLLCGAAAAVPPWTSRLQHELALLERAERIALGVHVLDLDSGVSVSHRADESWYLASMVKVPVAIAVLRGIEAGRYGFDTTLTLRASDYVDGAGATNGYPVGARLTIRFLLEQMIVYSDNTASDMLIDLVGPPEVNALVESLVPDGLRRITRLGDIRRTIYGMLVPNVDRLSGTDLLLLRRARSDAELVQLLRQMVRAPTLPEPAVTLNAAFDAFYASGLNSGRLDAYGDLLAKLADGQTLSPQYTDYLMTLMERIATGTRRIKAGLPSTVRFAHKTGTQRRRACDAGVVRWSQQGQPRRALVVACVRDAPTLERAEALLMRVGRAACISGLFLDGVDGAPLCPAAEAVPHSAPAAVGRR